MFLRALSKVRTPLVTARKGLARGAEASRATVGTVSAQAWPNAGKGRLLVGGVGAGAMGVLSYACAVASQQLDTDSEGKRGRSSIVCSMFEPPKTFPTFNGIVRKYTLPVVAICTTHVVVFALWRVPRLNQFMYKHFTCSLAGIRKGRLHTLITSVFSHQGGFHLIFNTIALSSISPILVQLTGGVEFMAFYLTTGILSSSVSVAFQGVRASLVRSVGSQLAKKTAAALTAQPALGASGAVFGCFAVSASLFPDNSFVLIFLPMFPIAASTLLPCMVLFDLAGTVYSFFKSSPLGHVAHLGGVACGVLYYQYRIRHLPAVRRIQALRHLRRPRW